MVFERLVDHEDMRNWPGIRACRLVREGEPKNGLGAVRAVTAGGITLHEKVVHFEPPSRFEYTIIKGLPINHLGTVTLAEDETGVRIDWHIVMTSKVPGLAWLVGQLVRRGLPRALAYFKTETERAARAGA